MPTELLLLTIARALVEVAGCFMLGQGLLYVLAGSRRNDNFVYQLFALLTRPVMKVTRVITPRHGSTSASSTTRRSSKRKQSQRSAKRSS